MYVRFAPIATLGYQDEAPGRECQEQTPFLLFRRTRRPRTSATSYREGAGLEGREYRRFGRVDNALRQSDRLTMAIALTVRLGSFDTLPMAGTRRGNSERDGLGARQRTCASGRYAVLPRASEFVQRCETSFSAKALNRCAITCGAGTSMPASETLHNSVPSRRNKIGRFPQGNFMRPVHS
jgi:hypothetical protein